MKDIKNSLIIFILLIFITPFYSQVIKLSSDDNLSYNHYYNQGRSKKLLTQEEDRNCQIVFENYGYHRGIQTSRQCDEGRGVYIKNRKSGEWKYYFNGIIKEKSYYVDGFREGATFIYKDNGKISDTLYYIKDNFDGVLNMEITSNFFEFQRKKRKYSLISTKYTEGNWVDTNSELIDDTYYFEYVGKRNKLNKRNGNWSVFKIDRVTNEKYLFKILNYNSGARNGTFITFYPSGNVYEKGTYENGLLDGKEYTFYENGNIKSIRNYKNNIEIEKPIGIEEDGIAYQYDEEYNKSKITDQNILSQLNNIKNPNLFNETKSDKEVKNITTTNNITESENNDVYNSAGVDKRPSFIGGNGDLNAYVNESFNNKSLSGKIFVSFVIEKDGNLSSLKVLRDIGEGSGDEVVRILNLCKNCWSPAEIKDKKVRCSYSLPISINN